MGTGSGLPVQEIRNRGDIAFLLPDVRHVRRVLEHRKFRGESSSAASTGQVRSWRPDKTPGPSRGGYFKFGLGGPSGPANWIYNPAEASALVHHGPDAATLIFPWPEASPDDFHPVRNGADGTLRRRAPL